MRLSERKVLFFIVGNVPTSTEAALIARVEGIVKVRSLKGSTLYGARVEPCDAVAGSPPQVYLDAFPNVTPNAEGADASVTNAEVVSGVTVTGSGTNATFTVVGGAITAIALA